MNDHWLPHPPPPPPPPPLLFCHLCSPGQSFYHLCNSMKLLSLSAVYSMTLLQVAFLRLSSFLIILPPTIEVCQLKSARIVPVDFPLRRPFGLSSLIRYHLPNLVDFSRLPVCRLPPEVGTLCCSPDTQRLLAINTAFNTRYSVEATA